MKGDSHSHSAAYVLSMSKNTRKSFDGDFKKKVF